MLVRVHAESAAAVDINADITWRASASGQFGSCTISIPRNSAAWSTAVIFETGRYLVEALTRYGVWRGVSNDAPRYTARGVQVDVDGIEAWTSIRYVSIPRLFQAAPAGMIAREAVRQAIIGHDGMPLTLGQFVCCPPLVTIELGDQSVSEVLAELIELTGQEWYIGSDLSFNWVMRQGSFRPFVITDDGRLFDEIRMQTAGPGEAIEVDDLGRRFTAYSSETSRIWPSQEIERI